MKKLAISGLNAQERQALVELVKQNIKESDSQAIIVESLNFIEDILEKLKGHNISLAKIKAMLGLASENINQKN